jgi:hypothetical protein
MTLSPGFEVIMVPNCLSQERLMKVLQTIIGGGGRNLNISGFIKLYWI